jgi:hypothetical protein
VSVPRWQRVAEAGYGVLLHLYPRRIRERHGEEMAQAFRDRCREVSTGHRSILQLFGHDLAPDFASSLVGAHLEEPLMPKARAAIVALALLACAWLFQDAISRRFLDAYFAVALRYEHWQESRAISSDEAHVRALAEDLSGNPSATDWDRSLAAYLYAVNFAEHRYMETYHVGTLERLAIEVPQADGRQALRLLAKLDGTTDAGAARLALAACVMVVGCDRHRHAQALARIEPENGFAWAELLRAHSWAGNEALVQSDLRRVGDAHYYGDGMRAAWRAMWSNAQRAAPGDAATFGALGRQLVGAGARIEEGDFTHDLMYVCRLSEWPNAPKPWLNTHPSSRGDCARAAVVYANSQDPMASRWGWHWLDKAAPSGHTHAGFLAAEARAQGLANFGGEMDGSHYWRPWTDAEWMAWASAKPRAN